MPVSKSAQPILKVSQLSIVRDRTPILSDVSWEVLPGEHWVLLGANGSGKTSLLAALTGYLMPTSGEMSLLGEIYGESDWRELRTRVGLVSSSIRQLMAESEPALDTVASGRHAMIDYWGTPSTDERREAAAILKSVECSHIADRPWAVLSQGERQRVLIGRALMAHPRILILDEPCAGLDPVAREDFLDFIERLSKPDAHRRKSRTTQKSSPPTLILVTHHVEEIRPCFTHALLLKQGRVVGSGPIASQLNSARLSDTFRAPVKVIHRNHRYQLLPHPK